jgi:putative ABC transport system permease protein
LRDVAGVATVGPRTRRLRSAMTALGIAIGIAAVVAVLGISSSSRAQLIAELEELGTNRLEVRAGQSLTGSEPELPEEATTRIGRIAGVQAVTSVTTVDASLRRTDLIDPANTLGITVRTTEPSLLSVVGGTIASGRFLDAASASLPTVVLGSTAAERLGIEQATGQLVIIGGEWFSVIGILDPVPLYGQLDSSAFIGRDVATDVFGTELSPSSIYVTVEPDQVDRVRALLAASASPARPSEVDVSNPSDALAAQDAVDANLTAMLLGLGGVALLVGGISIANVMVIGVLERRTEIGVRRALGATQRHIRVQFLAEAVLLSGAGGLAGVVLGAGVTAGYTTVRDTALSVPPIAVVGGLGAALIVGTIAGLSPASRAARMAPADAIRPA